MEILLASHNQHKANEIREMLDAEIQLLTLSDVGFDDEIIENGHSFKENAFIKAKSGFEASNIPTFADDSGLCVDALNGEPGIHSARYATSGKSEDNNEKLLKSLKNSNNRNAHFHSTLCFYDGKNQYFFEGSIKGIIIEEYKGNAGFGYDPIFIPEGHTQTFAEISPQKKNEISHRALAMKKFLEFLKNYSWNSSS